MADRGRAPGRRPADPPTDEGAKRVVLAVLAVLVALAAGVAVGAVVFGGDDDPERNETVAPGSTAPGETGTTSGGESTTTAPGTGAELPPTTVDTAGLSGAALELADAINRAHQLTYHATFELRTAEGTTILEVWRRLPEARRDTILGDPPQQIHTREFRTADGRHVGCLGSPAAPDDEEDLCFAAPAAGAVAARDDTVRGIPVRCFTVTTESGTVQEACFDSEGIPAAIDGGDGRLERIALERGVASEDLVPPDVPDSGSPP